MSDMTMTSAERLKKWRKHMKELGLCTHCGKRYLHHLNGRVFSRCKPCLIQQSFNCRKRRLKNARKETSED